MLHRTSGIVVYTASLAAASSTLAGGRASGADRSLPCAPSARLAGDTELVLHMQALLVRRGIVDASSGGTPGCVPLNVHVRLVRSPAPGVQLVIADPEGRTTSWQLNRAETAAMLIESWARTDPTSSLSPPFARTVRANHDERRPAIGPNQPGPPPESRPETIDAPATETSSLAAAAAVAPVAAAPAALNLSSGLDSGVDGSRSLWLGGSLGLCLRIGPVCTGAAARFGASSGHRRGEALATLELPRRIAGFGLVPNIGLGLARLRREGEIVSRADWSRADDRSAGDGGHSKSHDRSDDRRAGDGSGRSDERWMTNALRAYAGLALFRPSPPRSRSAGPFLRDQQPEAFLLGGRRDWSEARPPVWIAVTERSKPRALMLAFDDRRDHPPSDETLVAACAREESAALGALFDRHHGAVYRFFSRFAGVSEADLDELVSETFLNVYRSAGRFRGDAAVRTWITAIAANVARHHVRSESRRRAFLNQLRTRLQPPGVDAQRTGGTARAGATAVQAGSVAAPRPAGGLRDVRPGGAARGRGGSRAGRARGDPLAPVARSPPLPARLARRRKTPVSPTPISPGCLGVEDMTRASCEGPDPALRAHLRECARCRGEWEQACLIRDLGQLLPTYRPDPERRRQVRAALLDRTDEPRLSPAPERAPILIAAGAIAAVAVLTGLWASQPPRTANGRRPRRTGRAGATAAPAPLADRGGRRRAVPRGGRSSARGRAALSRNDPRHRGAAAGRGAQLPGARPRRRGGGAGNGLRNHRARGPPHRRPGRTRPGGGEAREGPALALPAGQAWQAPVHPDPPSRAADPAPARRRAQASGSPAERAFDEGLRALGRSDRTEAARAFERAATLAHGGAIAEEAPLLASGRPRPQRRGIRGPGRPRVLPGSIPALGALGRGFGDAGLAVARQGRSGAGRVALPGWPRRPFAAGPGRGPRGARRHPAGLTPSALHPPRVVCPPTPPLTRLVPRAEPGCATLLEVEKHGAQRKRWERSIRTGGQPLFRGAGRAARPAGPPARRRRRVAARLPRRLRRAQLLRPTGDRRSAYSDSVRCRPPTTTRWWCRPGTPGRW